MSAFTQRQAFSRRSFLAASGAGAALLGLAACGSSGSSDAADETREPTLSWKDGYNKDDWRATTTRTGKALGETKEADEQIRLTEAARTGSARPGPAQ